MNKQIERVNVFISRAASIRVESHLRLYLELGCARIERRSVTRNRGRGSIKRPDIEYPEHGSRYSLLRKLCSSPLFVARVSRFLGAAAVSTASCCCCCCCCCRCRRRRRYRRRSSRCCAGPAGGSRVVSATSQSLARRGSPWIRQGSVNAYEEKRRKREKQRERERRPRDLEEPRAGESRARDISSGVPRTGAQLPFLEIDDYRGRTARPSGAS